MSNLAKAQVHRWLLLSTMDLIYNPAWTDLLQQAQRREIPCAGGLIMLVAQAKRAAELFTGKPIADACIAQITAQLQRQMENVVLIGMPGCGKTTVGRLLAEKLGRPFYDADTELERQAGCKIPEIFQNQGEGTFRALETQVLADLGKQSGVVIATGGGCVTRPENYALLHQNSRIVWIKRSLDQLPVSGRPVSQSTPLEQLYARRKPLYEAFADFIVDSTGWPERTAERIMEELP